ncbi:hypothetical protein HV560_00885 [Mannheimia pernigra]|uniref:YD repeat-containing protein n=1 Tax=Mannheimia pernigra TaxID=111844 RepID=A0ABD7A5X5_9PAST|nr:hypothetical protein [Mannheimia pernigra]QLB41504.1 hypothetical protein HV560_00885 [Mannheimia pernigra]
MIEFYSYWILFNQECDDKYTYNNYDRIATRSFDTDSKKEGFERVDTYQYDQYGREIRADSNFTGDNLTINSYLKKEFDLYGRVSTERIFDSNDVLTKKNDYGYDAYGQRIRETTYATEDSINIQFLRERDEYGRNIKYGRDLNMNGVLDLGDNYRAYTYNDQGQPYKTYDVLANGDKTATSLWFYDEFGRRAYSIIDANNNGKWDDREYKHVDTYHGTRTDRDESITYTYQDDKNPIRIVKFVYQNAGDQGYQIGTLDAPQGKEFKSFSHNVYGSVVSSTEDYTTENWHRFFDKVGGHIQVINMSDARAKTEITLDNDVLRKITTGSELRIAGDSTDVVNLKNSHEFKKLDETKKVSNQEYNQYTTQVDGHDYTLLIDTDITTNLLP